MPSAVLSKGTGGNNECRFWDAHTLMWLPKKKLEKYLFLLVSGWLTVLDIYLWNDLSDFYRPSTFPSWNSVTASTITHWIDHFTFKGALENFGCLNCSSPVLYGRFCHTFRLPGYKELQVHSNTWNPGRECKGDRSRARVEKSISQNTGQQTMQRLEGA